LEEVLDNKFLGVAVFSLLALGSASQAATTTLAGLQGAWAMGGTKCENIFTKVGKSVEFQDRNSSLTTGIIIRGNEIRGPLLTCTVAHVHEKKDYVSVNLNCADAIMFDNISVSLQKLDSTTFKRFDPEFPEIHVTYTRCDL
jgi:hypothetical protein